jgi:hypothetical protein
MSGSTINTVCTRPSSTSYSFGFLAEDKPKWGKQRQRQKAKAKGKQMQSREHGVVLHSPTQPQSRKVERKTSETSGCNRYNLSTCDHFSATLGIVDKE